MPITHVEVQHVVWLFPRDKGSDRSSVVSSALITASLMLKGMSLRAVSLHVATYVQMPNGWGIRQKYG